MNDLVTNVVVNMLGDLNKKVDANTRAIQGMSRKGGNALDNLDKKQQRLNNNAAKLKGRILGAVSAYKILQGISTTVDFDARLTQLQTDGRATPGQISTLKQQITTVANDRNVRLSREQLLTGFDEVIAQTGNFPDAVKNLKNMAMFMRATGTEAKDAGSLISIAFKNGVTDASEVLKILDAQLQQSLQGSVPIRDLARTGKGFVAPASASIGPSKRTIIDSSAVMQVTIDAVKTPDVAAEAVKAVLSALNDKKNQKRLSRLGVDVKQPGTNNLKQLSELIPQVFDAFKGDFGRLQKFAGESGVKVFQGFSLPGNRKQLEQLASIQADGELLVENARINAGTAKAAGQSILNSGVSRFDSLVSNPTKNLANTFDSATENSALATLKNLAGQSANPSPLGGLWQTPNIPSFNPWNMQDLYKLLTAKSNEKTEPATENSALTTLKNLAGQSANPSPLGGLWQNPNTPSFNPWNMQDLYNLLTAKNNEKTEPATAKIQLEVISDKGLNVKAVDSKNVDLEINTGQTMVGQ